MSDSLVIHRPPQKKIHSLDYTRHRVYLSGAMTGEDWQSKFTNELDSLRVDVFSPRYPSSHTVTPPDGLFEWEIDHMSIANVIAFNFIPDEDCSSALIALGMYAKTDRIIVCCPDGFFKKGDIDALCNREDIPQVDSLDLLIKWTIARISPQTQSSYGDLMSQFS